MTDLHGNVINFGYARDYPVRIKGVRSFDLRCNCVNCGDTISFQPQGDWSINGIAYGQCPRCSTNYKVEAS